MARGKISLKTVEAASADNRDTYIWDADIAGFGLKVTPANNKIYLIQYRVGGRRGRTRRVTLGKHGSPWTPHTARKEAKRLLGVVAAGADPAEERTRARRDMTVADLCDHYLAAASSGQILTKFDRPKRASTVATDRGRIERHIKPLLGRRPLSDVTKRDIQQFLHDVAAGKTATDVRTGPRGRAIVKGGRGTATRTLGLLSGIFTHAVEKGWRNENPVGGVQRFKDQRNERFLTVSELSRLGEALAAANRDGENELAIAAIRMLALTGARKSEILSLRWDWVDWDRSCLRLPDSKTGQRIIHIGAAALAVLSAVPHTDSAFVFPATTGSGHYVGLPRVWAKVRRRADLDGVRLHDLRHSFAAVAAAGGNSLLIIGKLLGHRDATTTQRYAHLADDPVKESASNIAELIAAALDRPTRTQSG